MPGSSGTRSATPNASQAVKTNPSAASTPTLFYSTGTCAFSEVILLQWLDLPHRLCRVSRDERRGER